jgi:SAM-dependent methyltransferase
VKESFLPILRCPRCRYAPLELETVSLRTHEIREGTLGCARCLQRYPIRGGICRMLPFPTPELLRERDARNPAQRYKRCDDRFLLALPRPSRYYDGDYEGPYTSKESPTWKMHADNFDALLPRLKLDRIGRSLELGAGNGWATRCFARRGIQGVAVDLVEEKYRGLGSADVYFEKEAIFFERIAADMHNLPFVDESFDLVFCTAVLHHSSSLRLLFREIKRVLKPDGVCVAINESMRNLITLDRVPRCPQVDAGINEHRYHLLEYAYQARRNGLRFDFHIDPRHFRLDKKEPTVAPLKKLSRGITRLLFRLIPLLGRMTPSRRKWLEGIIFGQTCLLLFRKRRDPC